MSTKVNKIQNPKNKISVKEDRKVKIEHDFNLSALLISALDQHGIKIVLKYIEIISLSTSQDKIIWPLSYFATQTDADNMQAAIILKYVRDHWDLTFKRALPYWKQLMQKASRQLEEKQRLEEAKNSKLK